MNAINTFPPNRTDFISIICSGEIDTTSFLTERVKNCQAVIAVNGGVNHCKNLNITPHYIVWGLLDAESRSEVSRIYPTVPTMKSQKDIADIEVAIAKAKEISQKAQVVIFGGSGGRMDETLRNIYLLLKNPGLCLESEKECLFGLDSSSGEAEIDPRRLQNLYLFPLYGKAKNVTISTTNKVCFHSLLNQTSYQKSHFVSGRTKVGVGEGEVIVSVMKQEYLFEDFESDPNEMKYKTVRWIEIPVYNLLDKINQLSLMKSSGASISTDFESIQIVHPASKVVACRASHDNPISLIPFFGSVQKIEIQFLKFSDNKKVTELTRERLSLSNSLMDRANKFQVQVGEGELLCIRTSNFVTLEKILSDKNNKSKPQSEVSPQASSTACASPSPISSSPAPLPLSLPSLTPPLQKQ